MISADQLKDPQWAWAPFTPDSTREWNLCWAGHLYRRAAFGGTWAELQRAISEGPVKTVERLLQPGAEFAEFTRTFDSYAGADAESANADQAQAWWLRRMIETPHPLLERMTLFWHGFFGISNKRVGHVPSMNRYIAALRRNALGNYAALLGEMISTPAFLIGLDAAANRKAQPEQFLARLLLEQYTVGPGHFAEQDVHELARCFAGRFVFNHAIQEVDSERDRGVKRVLGKEGAFDARSVLPVLLQNPAAAENIVRRLYGWLISETDAPTPELIQALATEFGRDHDMGRLVGTMLRSNLFFSPVAYRRRVKSSVEFALSIIRPTGAVVPTLRLGAVLSELGQALYEPPTIKGWAGGRHWLNRFTIARRARLAQELFAESGSFGGKLDPAQTARRSGFSSREAEAQFVFNLWLQGDVPEGARATANEPGSAIRQLATTVVSLPEFQLG